MAPGRSEHEETYEGSVTQTLTFDGTAMAGADGRPVGPDLPDRYVDLGFIASGAMGEVRKVRDRRLNTIVAMKLLRAEARVMRVMRARFEEEARLTAQLRHPHIVAVHDSGLLPDGRMWFTMELIEGETLDAVVQRVHAARSSDQWRATRDGWTLRSLIRAFGRVCEAIALAHERGVIHRDLKPRNLMVGPHGLVKVMDWGIAKGLGYDLGADSAALETFPSGHRTVFGRVVGTPAYMAPEQARGERDTLGPQADVYGLGAVLYFILCGKSPYRGEPQQIIDQVKAGPPPPVERALGSPAPTLPQVLVEICARAMQRDPSDRYADASELASAISAWLTDDERGDVARAVLRRAQGLQPELHRLFTSALALRQSARTMLASLPLDAGPELKAAAWQLAQYADENMKQHSELASEVEELLWAALTIAPGHDEARRSLARIQRDAMELAESQGRIADLAERETLLSMLNTDGAHDAFLAGDATLSLATDPPGAVVELYRFVESDRKLGPAFVRRLSPTPLRREPLGWGTWLLRLTHPDTETVDYPVSLRRDEHLVVAPMGNDEPTPIALPPKASIESGICYIPAGPAYVGGDEGTDAIGRRRLWFDGLLVDRHPVTLLDFLGILERTLEREGPEFVAPLLDIALFNRRVTAVLRSGRVEIDDPDFGSLATCAVLFRTREHIDVCLRDVRAQRGPSWRLLDALEWERVARGPEGRRLPWGSSFEPSHGQLFAGFRDPFPVPVGSGLGDRSVYGVCDLMSTVGEATGTSWFDEPPADGGRFVWRGDPPPLDLVLKGGSALDPPPWSLPESRHRYVADAEAPDFKLRFCSPWPIPAASRRRG